MQALALMAVVILSTGSGLATVAVVAAAAEPSVSVMAGKGAKLSPRLVILASGTGFASPRAQARALSVPASGAGSLVRRTNGRVLVEIRTSSTSGAAVANLRARGAHVVNVSPTYATVTATVSPSALQSVAADRDVKYVSEVLAPQVGRADAGAQAKASATPFACAPIVSEGDSLMNVDAARVNSALDGASETIGILSDSFNTDSTAATHAANDVADGELPGASNPCGHTSPVVVQSDYSGGGQTDEGRAMAQLAHDLAPGARLAFATAFNGELDLASQITRLRTVNHASVIVDDVSYFDEPFFQDGPIANAAKAASAAGVPYFSSAGNSNVIVGGKNVSSYEAPLYRGLTCPPALAPFGVASCHDFDATAGTDTNGDEITLAPGGGFVLDLQWAQPRGGVTSDYDVFVLDATGTVVSGSNGDNLASQKPYEAFGYQNTSASPRTVRIVIARYSGNNARLKFVLMGSAGITAVEHNTSTDGDVVGPSIFGHNGTSSVASTAAIPYDNSNRSENFSSRGPVTLYYQPTPSTAALGTPQVLDQPSFAATDGVQTSFFAQQVGGVWRFYGTSAAAPQAAAIGALLQEKNPGLTPAQLIATLSDTARPVATNGTPAAVGGGYLDADAALASVPSLPGAPTLVSATSGDGQATVQWTAAASNPNFPITGYTITPVLGGVPQPDQTFAATPTSALVTGLTNGGSYEFTVTATNANGDGPPSAATSPINLGAPGPPSGVVASPGNGQAKVTWTAPTVTNGSSITGYKITPRIGGVTQPAQTFTSTATTQTISALTNTTSATFTVAAVNANGIGPVGAPSAAITIGTPTMPTAVTAVPGNGGATVSWHAPASNSGAAVTRYTVTPYLGGVAQAPRVFNNTATSQVLSGLTNGGSYQFAVAATNARGLGPKSALTAARIVGAPLAPTAPTAAPRNASASIHWTAPTVNNGAAITRYVITPYIAGAAQAPRTYMSTATTQTVTGLTNTTAYTFRIAAGNARGTGVQSGATPAITVGTPSAPTNVTAATAGHQAATVQWTAPAGNGATVTGYVVTPYIGTVGQTPRVFNTTATTQTITGATTGQKYTFKVSAINARGTGPKSAASNVVTIT